MSLNASNSGNVVDAVLECTEPLGLGEGVTAPNGLRYADIAHEELILVPAAATPLSRRRTPWSPEGVAELALTSRGRGSRPREVLESSFPACPRPDDG